MSVVADPANMAGQSEPDNEAAYQREIHQMRMQMRVQAQIAAAHLPAEYQQLDVAAVQPRDGQQAAHATVRAWALGRLNTSGLLLHGEPGRGKTFTAAFACHLWLAAHPKDEALWIDVSVYTSALGLDFKDPRRDAALRLPDLDTNRTTALFLDDLDAHKLSEIQTDWLYRVVKRWETEGWPVIATTHRNHRDLKARFTPKGKVAAADAARLAESLSGRLEAMCHPVAVTGKNHRERKAS